MIEPGTLPGVHFIIEQGIKFGMTLPLHGAATIKLVLCPGGARRGPKQSYEPGKEGPAEQEIDEPEHGTNAEVDAE